MSDKDFGSEQMNKAKERSEDHMVSISLAKKKKKEEGKRQKKVVLLQVALCQRERKKKSSKSIDE